MTAATTVSPRWTKRLTLLVALCCVALQLGRRLDLAALSAAIWLPTVFFTDRHALRRMLMPKFWTVTIAVALGSGLFLGPRDLEIAGLRLSAQGLEAGALMVVRGLFIFALVSWAARAIEGASATRLARRIGLGNLGVAVGTAFSVIPALRDQLQRRKGQRRWRHIAVDGLTEAARLADQLTMTFGAPRAAFVAVEGARGEGKTTAVRALAEALSKRGIVVGGVLQPPVDNDEGHRLGYDLEDIQSGERFPLARRREQGRGYDFDDDGWSWAAERLAEAKQARDVVVIDELGLLEARGEGHIPALLQLAQGSMGRASLLVAAVREGCLDSLLETLGEPERIIEAPVNEVEEIATSLVAVLHRARNHESEHS